MSDKQANNPLHGITLESLLSELVSLYGWQGLAERLPINCFSNEPSIKSSLSFLRRTSWARQKVEALYLASQDDSLQQVDAASSTEPRTIMSRPQASGKKTGERRPRQGYGTDRAPRAEGDRPQGERSFRRDGERPQGERSFRRDGDRPQGERSFRRDGDRPQGERNFRRDGDRPQGERSFRRDGDRPQGERNSRPYGNRPQGERAPRRDGERPQGGNRPYRDHAQGTERLFRNDLDPVQQERVLQQQEALRRQGTEPKSGHHARAGERQHGRDHQHARPQHRERGQSNAPRAAKPAAATGAKSPWGTPKKKEQDAE